MVKHILGGYISCSSAHGCTTLQESVSAPVNPNGQHIEKNLSRPLPGNRLNFALRGIGKPYFICNIFISIRAVNPVRTDLS